MPKRRLVALLGVLLMAPLSSASEPNDAPPALTLQQAVERTLERHPELAVFPARRRAAQARLAEATLRPELVASLEIENAAGSGSLRGTEAAEFTLALSQVLELGGQRARRIDVARGELDVLEAERAMAQWDLLAELARRFIAVARLQARQALAEEAVALAQSTANEVGRRVQTARSPVAEGHRAEVALIRARLSQAAVDDEWRAARRALAAMWGADQLESERVQADLMQWPSLSDDPMWAARLASSPRFRRFASEERVREAEVQLARARARGTLTWSLGVRRLQESDEDALVAGVSRPLFAARRAQPEIARALAQRESTTLEREAAARAAEAALFGLLEQARQSVREATALKEQVIPKMQAALEATEYAWRRGRYGYLELTEAQQALMDVRWALIETAARAHELRVEVERLTGSSTTLAIDRSGVGP